MSPWLGAGVMGCLGVLAAFGLVRDLRTGVSRSFVREYRVDDDPVGYTVCIVGDLFVIALGAATILYALGVIGNPVDAIDSVLPPFLHHQNPATG